MWHGRVHSRSRQARSTGHQRASLLEQRAESGWSWWRPRAPHCFQTHHPPSTPRKPFDNRTPNIKAKDAKGMVQQRCPLIPVIVPTCTTTPRADGDLFGTPSRRSQARLHTHTHTHAHTHTHSHSLTHSLIRCFRRYGSELNETPETSTEP